MLDSLPEAWHGRDAAPDRVQPVTRWADFGSSVSPSRAHPLKIFPAAASSLITARCAERVGVVAGVCRMERAMLCISSMLLDMHSMLDIVSSTRTYRGGTQ